MKKKAAFYFTQMDSPLGVLTLVASEKGLCNVQFGCAKRVLPEVKAWMKKHSLKQELIEDDAQVSEPRRQLDAYFRGERKTFDLSLDVYGTPFQKKVWEQLRIIGYGKTVTYKELAHEIGAPKAVRAVGGANNKNPVPIIIPCHRVIGSNGSLVGYGGGLEKKEYLLHLEKNHCLQVTV